MSVCICEKREKPSYFSITGGIIYERCNDCGLMLHKLNQEGWRDVPGWEGHYRISTFGRIMSVKNGVHFLMKIRPHSGIRDGKRLIRYMIVELRMPGKRKKYFMHVLMATIFIPNPDNLPVVNHEDGNTFNFALTNLKWVSRSDNAKHSWWRKTEPVLEVNDDIF